VCRGVKPHPQPRGEVLPHQLSNFSLRLVFYCNSKTIFIRTVGRDGGRKMDANVQSITSGTPTRGFQTYSNSTPRSSTMSPSGLAPHSKHLSPTIGNWGTFCLMRCPVGTFQANPLGSFTKCPAKCPMGTFCTNPLSSFTKYSKM
jgi:hypothetical protein